MLSGLLSGVVLLGPTAEVPLETVKAGFAVNVFGLLDMCQVSGIAGRSVKAPRYALSVFHWYFLNATV